MIVEIMTGSILLRGVLLMLSFIGLILLFRNLFHINSALIPVLVISLIICTLQISGLLGGLTPVIYIVYLTGFLAYPAVIIYRLVSKTSRVKQPLLLTHMSFWVLLLFTAFLVLLLNNMHLSHYDNFSHWALAAKELLILDTLPDASSAALMDFTSYPLGSSLFIYYGCRMIGRTEGVMLILQGVFLVSCMLPLLVFNRKLVITIFPVIILIYLVFMIEPKIFNLLVDTLLAGLGFASLMIILYYRKDPLAAFLISLPVMIALVLVKNSGIFFAAIDVIILCYFSIKSGHVRNFIFPVLSALFVGATIWTWNLHCQTVFPDVVSKHALTSSNFKSILAGKTVADIRTIAGLMKEKILNIDDSFVRSMLILNFVALCARWWKKLAEEDERKVTKVILSLDFAFIFYYIGIFAMYVFSMPLNEALNLAGYERYMVTIVLYLVFVFCAYLIYISGTGLHPGKKSNRYAWVLLYCLVLFAGYNLAEKNSNIFSVRREYEETNPANALMIENFETPDATYVMYIPEKYRSQFDTAYFNYLMKYKLHTASCYPFLLGDLDAPDDESVIRLVRDYDYFIIYDDDAFIQRFANAHMNEPDTAVGIYEVNDYPDLRN